MARFEWEDEDDDKPTAPTAPPTPTAQVTSTRGTQQTIEGWLNRIEAIDKAKADNLRNEPTQANAQAAVAAQDAAMKQAEAIQQNAIGIQQRAILQAKAVKNSQKLAQNLAEETNQQNPSTITRSANQDRGSRNADHTTTEGDMYKVAQEIKRERKKRNYSAKK